MERVRELIREILAAHPDDNFFSQLDEDGVPGALIRGREKYAVYERAFSVLDDLSWAALKKKAIAHFKNERKGQLKEGFFHQLNEAFAYEYLKQVGSSDIQFIPETNSSRTSDIRFVFRGKPWYCEVKSMGLSELEVLRRYGGCVDEALKEVKEERRQGYRERFHDGSDYAIPHSKLIEKLEAVIQSALGQIPENSNGLIFVFYNPDDMLNEHAATFKAAFSEYLASHPERSVVVKIGLEGLWFASSREPIL